MLNKQNKSSVLEKSLFYLNSCLAKSIFERKRLFAGNVNASGCWHSALGAGMLYNREKNQFLINLNFVNPR